jgi:hypothetical protein
LLQRRLPEARLGAHASCHCLPLRRADRCWTPGQPATGPNRETWPTRADEGGEPRGPPRSLPRRRAAS